ncbi:MAG: peptidoglycan DD-metalloendopeptidase family protein [Pseudomonadota bacterium]
MLFLWPLWLILSINRNKILYFNILMFCTLNKSSLFFYFLVISIFIVYGCTTNTYVPVENRGQNNGLYKKSNKKRFNKKITFHYVRKRDTLYSIAWQYGLDFKDIAKWNHIKSPYLIRIGEKIRLLSFKKQNGKTKKQLKKQPKTFKKAKLTTISKSSKKNKINKQTTKKVKRIKKQTELKYKTKLSWVWPARGKIIQRFTPSKGKKGIDISVNKGARIKATEAGKVVYSGHGLQGYGLLLIIKHNNQYLSAYAHNSKLLIGEGSKVKRGQVIALAGKTASERVKLHFEIRKNGKPVNPLKFLPKH